MECLPRLRVCISWSELLLYQGAVTCEARWFCTMFFMELATMRTHREIRENYIAASRICPHFYAWLKGWEFGAGAIYAWLILACAPRAGAATLSDVEYAAPAILRRRIERPNKGAFAVDGAHAVFKGKSSLKAGTP